MLVLPLRRAVVLQYFVKKSSTMSKSFTVVEVETLGEMGQGRLPLRSLDRIHVVDPRRTRHDAKGESEGSRGRSLGVGWHAV